MKDWFKARNIWGAAILSMSDAEAGRLAKAIWTYTMKHEELNLSGAERGMFAMVLMQLDLDDQAEAEISAKRAEAGALGGKHTQANNRAEKQEEANQANATIKNKNKEEDKEIKKIPSKEGTKESAVHFTPPTLEEVKEYCLERNNGVNAQKWYDFYASKGWKVGNQGMKDWKAAVRTWEQRDNGTQTNTRPALKIVHAQSYTQRQYTEDELAGDSTAELMKEAAML